MVEKPEILPVYLFMHNLDSRAPWQGRTSSGIKSGQKKFGG